MSSLLTYTAAIVYAGLLLYAVGRILLGTHSTSKTLAYLLLVIVVPLAGILFYFAFGINYRHTDMTRKGIASYRELTAGFREKIPDETLQIVATDAGSLAHYSELVKFISTIGQENLSRNTYQLLINGEEKFPEALKALEDARSFIHMEYYAWENDTTGNRIKDVLLKKAAEGVTVRVIYDDYASRSIRRTIVKQLRKGGVQIYPMVRLRLARFIARMNHRDHRKVIIVDGHTGFVGGINISDRYDNSIDTGLYWRDTHVKITGPAVLNLQRHFIIHWNECQSQKLGFEDTLFPYQEAKAAAVQDEAAQIVAGGPVSPIPTIMLSYFRIFTLARERLYITNPYFIPNDSILDALKEAAISGTDTRLVLPMNSDSAIVGAAAKFYFRELLSAGVKIYLYKKGFIHAKTVVADGYVSVVGTANMDIRSFDLNFEIMSVIYGKDFARQMERAFLHDLEDCHQVTLEEWKKTKRSRQLLYATARLISEFL